MKLGMQVGHGPGHIVLDGDPDPLHNGGRAPLNFWPTSVAAKWLQAACLLWPNDWEDQDRSLHGGRPHLRRLYLTLLSSTLPKKGRSPPIFGLCLLRPNGCLDQDATWYAGRPQPRRLSYVLDGTQLPPQKGHTHPYPSFGPCLLWPKRLDEDATWYGSRPRHRPHCIRRGPSCPRKGHCSPPLFAHVYFGHDRPSQLLLSSCLTTAASRLRNDIRKQSRSRDATCLQSVLLRH